MTMPPLSPKKGEAAVHHHSFSLEHHYTLCDTTTSPLRLPVWRTFVPPFPSGSWRNLHIGFSRLDMIAPVSAPIYVKEG